VWSSTNLCPHPFLVLVLKDRMDRMDRRQQTFLKEKYKYKP